MCVSVAFACGIKEWLPLSSKATAKILLFFDICKKNRHEGDFLLFYIFHALSYSFLFLLFVQI